MLRVLRGVFLLVVLEKLMAMGMGWIGVEFTSRCFLGNNETEPGVAMCFSSSVFSLFISRRAFFTTGVVIVLPDAGRARLAALCVGFMAFDLLAVGGLRDVFFAVGVFDGAGGKAEAEPNEGVVRGRFDWLSGGEALGAGLGVFTLFAGLGVVTLMADDLVALVTAGLGVRDAEDLVILETAGLGVRVLAAELAVARVSERGVLSLTAGLGVFVLVADVDDLVFLFGVVTTGVEEADLEAVVVD